MKTLLQRAKRDSFGCLKALFIFFCVPAAMSYGATGGVSVQVAGRTATQVTLSYTAAGTCSVEVSENPSYSPLVHDVDPVLFAGADLDTRPEAISTGSSHVFVVGKRLTEKGADGLNYSRGLQANTVHYFRIRCGAAVGTGTFSTANIPFGNTYTDGLQNDPSNPSGYVYPTLLQDRNQQVIDPQTGLLMKPMTLASDITVAPNTPGLRSGGFMEPCNPKLDANGFYHCHISNDYAGMLYAIHPVTGEVRFLGALYDFGQRIGLRPGVDPYNIASVKTPAWDTSDANVMYTEAYGYGGNTVLVKLTYTGNDQSVTTGREGEFPPMAPHAVAILTAETGPNSLAGQLQAFNSSYDPSKFQCQVDAYQAGHLALSCRRGQQDTYGWIGAYDLGNKLPLGAGGTGKVKALAKMWEMPGSRWCGDHSYEFLGDVAVLSHSTQFLKGTAPVGHGQYITMLTSPMPPASPGDTTTIQIASTWDGSWGSVPFGFQPGEPLSSTEDHFLMQVKPGDLFWVGGEFVQLQSKVSSSTWIVKRGVATAATGIAPVAHSAGDQMVAECNSNVSDPYSPTYMWWSFLDDPSGTDPNFYRQAPGSHPIARNPYRINEGYSFRVAPLTDVSRWGLGVDGFLNTSPSFAGAHMPADGNYFEKHVSMPFSAPPWFLDVLPFDGGNMNDAPSDSSTRPLGSNLYQYYYNGLDTPHYGGDGLNRKQVATFAFNANDNMIDMSGPGSVLTDNSTDNFKYCVANKDGECVASSNAGDIYFNVPRLDVGSRFCSGALFFDGSKNICIGDMPALGFSLVQFKVQGDNSGQSMRVLSKVFAAAHMSGTINSKPLPDGSWTMYYGPAYDRLVLMKIPPIPASDGVDRTTFVRATLNLTPPSSLGIVSAKVYFGYSEQGAVSQYYCTSRREACVSVSANIIDTNPFSYAQTDSYTPAACSVSCSVTLPVLPLHTAYFRVSYLNALGNEVAADLGVASEQSVVSTGSSITPPPPPPAILISLTPPSASLSAFQTAQFTATITGAFNTAVSWSLSPSVGTISNGLYTAPATISAAQTVTITATSVADATKSASATVQLTPPPVSITLSPSSATMGALQTQQITATVTGGTNTAVTWSMNPTVGTISNGLYTAPATISAAQTVTITATSVADATKFASVTVQLTPPNRYSYMGTITVPYTKVPNTDLANFPLLISGTYPDLANMANGGKVTNANGYDIIFTADAAGLNKLNFEQESYSAATGAVAYWVRVPMISHTADTVIYMFYANSAIVTDQSNKTAVWDNNYVSVWHLPNGVSLNANDSTASGNNGVLQGSPRATTGNIDGGADISPANSHVEANATGLPTANNAAFTIEGWQKSSGYISLSVIGGFGAQLPNAGDGSDGSLGKNRYLLEFNNHYYFWGGVTDWDTGKAFDSDNTWHHWAFTSDGSMLKFYKDGALQASAATPSFSTAGSYIEAGSHHNVGSNPATQVDEQRVSSMARSADWIAAEYSNQSNPPGFYNAVWGLTPGGADLPKLPPPVSITVSPSSTTMSASQTRQITATVTGSTNTAATWSMNPSVGTISNGLYTAPATITAAQTVTITATSVADTTKSASATVQLTPPPVSITVSPTSTTMGAWQTQQITATVAGSTNTAVTWSMNPSVGTISNGLYTAPATITAAQTVTITATSVADPTKSASATVQLTPPPVSITVSPTSATMGASQTRQITATVTGSTNTAVTWSMNPSVGTISNGLYTAPATITAAQTVTITATSVADTTKSASATVQLTPPPVSITVSPTSATMGASQTQQITATVTGSTNTAVTWSMNPSVGTISNGLYTAPATITAAQTVAITATSVADTTKSASATVKLDPVQSTGTATPFVTGYALSGPPLRNNFSNFVGMQFTVGSSPLTVSSLGRLCVAGNWGAHTVKLVKASNGADVAGGSLFVNMAGCTAGQFQYATLPSPITLSANTAYFVASLEVRGGDQWCDFGAVSSTNVAAVNNAVWFDGNKWNLVAGQNNSYVPVNFLYVAVSPGPPDMTIVATHSGDFTQGQTGASYLITVVNSGGWNTSATVSASDTVPAGLTATAIAGLGWNCTQPAGPCTRSDVLAAGSSYPLITLTVNVAVNAPASVTNTAAVSGGGESNIGDNTAIDSTTIQPAGTGTAFVTGYALNGPPLRNDFSNFVGMQFTVGSSPLTVSSLGRLCVAGNWGIHTVKLVKASDGADVAGGSLSVNMAGCTAGQFRYATLPSPITLSANTAYYVASLEVGGGDQWYDFGGISSTKVAAVNNAVWFDGYRWNLIAGPNSSYIPVSFLYQ